MTAALPRLGGVVLVALALGGAEGAGSATSEAASFAGHAAPAPVRSTVLATGAKRDRVARAEVAWCGTYADADRVPNAVAGHPAHWLYAVPADGEDRSLAVADRMQADAEEIDAWWRREDAARAPRNDLAPFSCGLQLDLSLLRLPQSGAALAGSARFGAIFNSLVAAGFRSARTKYIVYYDGPASDPRICGQGGSDRSGIGLAVVYTRACSGVSTAGVAAHELLHAFGAVASGAPNECAPPEDGHTCDDPRDLMHPRIGLDPLPEKLLDPGRDDYYGHSGPLLDTQDSAWLVQLDRQVPLALGVTGPGGVAADVPGLACDRPCTTTWNDGTRLELMPTPRPGRKFVRWSGSCTGTGSCVVTVGRAGAVSALFAPLAYRLSVRVTGQGAVRSGRPGIACRPRCAGSFASHVPVRLTARPAQGWRFRSWAGACSGSRPVCTVPMARAATARAIFVRA